MGRYDQIRSDTRVCDADLEGFSNRSEKGAGTTMKILVVYESTTGKTKAMAQAICRGITEAGGECVLQRAREFDGLGDACALALGCSTRMKRPLPKVRQIMAELPRLDGLKVTSFGSYGWSGEAPGIVADRLRELGGEFVGDGPLRVKGHPTQEDIEACENLGRLLVEKCR